MAKQQVIKSTSNYMPVQYCPICQVDHNKVYGEKIDKIYTNFDKSEKTEKDIKKHTEAIEKTKRGRTALILYRSSRGKNTLVCQASVEQIDKTMQHFSAPHFEKVL